MDDLTSHDPAGEPHGPSRAAAWSGSLVIFPVPRLAALLLVLLLPLLANARAAAGGTAEAVQLIDRMEERLAHCRDYQYLVSSFERQGDRKESRAYRLYVKDERLVKVKVVDGRGKGSEAVLDAKGRIRGRKSGLLKPFAQTLKPDDSRICSLRGKPFWEAACHNFLRELRGRITEPGTEVTVERDPENAEELLLVLNRPGPVRERYWIDSRQMHIVRGERFEGELLVQEFSIRDLKENVGLNDEFFSF